MLQKYKHLNKEFYMTMVVMRSSMVMKVIITQDAISNNTIQVFEYHKGSSKYRYISGFTL